MKKNAGIFVCAIIGLVLIITEISAKKLITDNTENNIPINYNKLTNNTKKQEINIKNENIVFLGDSITEIYPIDDIYDFINYLDDIGVNKELLFIIEKVFTNCKNENPYQLLDTLIPYIGKSKAYTHIKNKSR